MTQTGRSSQTMISSTIRHRRRLFAACLMLMLPLAGWADSLYVSDNLRVGVRDSAERNASTLTVITSGSKVELLERSGSFIKIRTSNGVEGWVKSAYFSKKKPSRLLLRETKNKLRQVESELEELRSSNNQNDPQLMQLKAEVSRLKSREIDLQQQLQQTQHSGTSSASNQSASISLRDLMSNNSRLLLSSVATLLVFLCMGFLIGVSWHKRQVTKRLGGLTL